MKKKTTKPQTRMRLHNLRNKRDTSIKSNVQTLSGSWYEQINYKKIMGKPGTFDHNQVFKWGEKGIIISF